MYVKEIDVSMDLGHVIEVILLCDQFFVDQLLDDCLTSVIDKIRMDNCIEICEATFSLPRCKKLLEAALFCITRYAN